MSIDLLDTDILNNSPIQILHKLDSLFAGSEWLSWEPETLLLKNLDVTDPIAKDKLLAVQAVASNSQAATSSGDAFEKVVMAFNNNHCIVDQYQPPEIEEVFYAVQQITKIITEIHDAEAIFTGEIPNYVAAVARFHRWIFLPNPLQFAQETLNSLNGLHKDGGKASVYSGLLSIAKQVSDSMAHTDSLRGDVSELGNWVGNSPQHDVARRMIGCYLYSPT